MSFSQAVEKNFDNNTSLIHSLSLNFIFERYFSKEWRWKTWFKIHHGWIQILVFIL